MDKKNNNVEINALDVISDATSCIANINTLTYLQQLINILLKHYTIDPEIVKEIQTWFNDKNMEITNTITAYKNNFK